MTLWHKETLSTRCWMGFRTLQLDFQNVAAIRHFNCKRHLQSTQHGCKSPVQQKHRYPTGITECKRKSGNTKGPAWSKM